MHDTVYVKGGTMNKLNLSPLLMWRALDVGFGSENMMTKIVLPNWSKHHLILTKTNKENPMSRCT